jgi:Transglutaminase-like superfamily
MLRTCLVLSVLFPVTVSGAEKPVKVPADSLKAYILKVKGREACGLYLQNRKVGWMLSETRLGTHDGKEVVISSEEALIALGRGKERNTLELKTTTVYSLEGNGAILMIENTEKQNDRPTVRRAIRRGDKLAITIQVNGRKTERLVPAPKENLAMHRRLHNWLVGTPKKGDRFESWTTSLEEKDIDTQDDHIFRGKKRVVLGGVPTDIYSVTVLQQGAKIEAEVRADGSIIKGQLGGIFEIRAELEKTVKNMDAKGVDLMSISSIAADKDLGRGSRVESLTLEVHGLGDFVLPLSHRQQLRKEKDHAILELRRDFRNGKEAPLTAAERKNYLEATPSIQADDAKILKLARRLVGKEKDPLKAADLLKSWVRKNLRPSYADNASTALEILENKAGDCTEHTLLFVTLARAAGIPAREVGGVAFVNEGQPMFGWHAWAEIHDGKQWVSVDPTWGQLYVDATHIKFSEGSKDWAWLNVLGRVKVKVVKFERK